MKKILVFFISLIIAAACYYDNEEALFPSLPGTCDTTSVSLALDVNPIISDNCLMCHSTLAAPSLGNNIKLEEFTDLSIMADAVLGSIKHDPAYSPMPKGGGKLNSCQIQKMEAWIAQGKNDN